MFHLLYWADDSFHSEKGLETVDFLKLSTCFEVITLASVNRIKKECKRDPKTAQQHYQNRPFSDGSAQLHHSTTDCLPSYFPFLGLT